MYTHGAGGEKGLADVIMNYERINPEMYQSRYVIMRCVFELTNQIAMHKVLHG